MKRKNEIYQKDYALLGMSLFVSIVVSGIILFCSLMADGFSMSVLPLFGANNQEIHANLNTPMILKNTGLSLLVLGLVYLVAFILLKYLEHGFKDGILSIPYKKDIYGKRILKKRTPLQDFMYGLGCYFS